ncbi:hypothetical protein HAZT_HAZT007360 [Hyalella azteca]|uniref:Hemocyanin C-terminal domain-containing protein n=1 Tax=Hyalella azteca TaxID=294128 RepID=A0A6A0GRH9_HYAAZ|nr:hypothetical protein HAZT_HAZT007360 [Hyalella azteca]
MMAIYSSESVKEVDLTASVSRLSHNDFTYKFKIKGEVEEHAVVRMFLCPRRDSNGIIYIFEEKRWNCIEMEKFWAKRKSSYSSITDPDVPSFKTLMAEADKAIAVSSVLTSPNTTGRVK